MMDARYSLALRDIAHAGNRRWPSRALAAAGAASHFCTVLKRSGPMPKPDHLAGGTGFRECPRLLADRNFPVIAAVAVLSVHLRAKSAENRVPSARAATIR